MSIIKMEFNFVNFVNITYIVVLGGIISSWVLQYVSKRKRIAKILALPKNKQDKALKSLVELIKLYKFCIFSWPIISIIFGIGIKVSDTVLNFYLMMFIMLLFYVFFIQGYFFEKKLFSRLSQDIAQNNL
jgi:hypothetical protein